MDDHFGIGLAFKVISLLGQFFPKSDIVFDNAVMHDGETAVIT